MKAITFLHIVLCFSLAFPPQVFAAQGQGLNRTSIEQVLKETGVGTSKAITFRQLYAMMKPLMGKAEQVAWYAAFFTVLDQKIPKMDASIQDKEKGRAELRLALNEGGESFVFQIINSEKTQMKVNGVAITARDLATDGGRAKILSTMTPQKAAVMGLQMRTQGRLLSYNLLRYASQANLEKYLTAVRELNMAAQDASEKMANVKTSAKKSAQNLQPQPFINVWMQLFAPEACAADGYTGQSCVDAGWIAEYVSGSTGPTCDAKKAKDYSTYAGSCSGSQVACNPAIFALQGGGGNAFCANNSGGRHLTATEDCNKASSIISIAKLIRDQAKKEATKAEMLKTLNRAVANYNKDLQEVISHCEKFPANTLTDQNGSPSSACSVLRTRMLDLGVERDKLLAELPAEAAVAAAIEPPPPPATAEPAAVVAGETDKKVLAAAPGTPPPDPKSTKSFFERNKGLIFGLLGAAAIGLVVWAATRDGDDDKKVADNPVTPVTPHPPVVPPVIPTFPVIVLKQDMPEISVLPTTPRLETPFPRPVDTGDQSTTG